jgi:uncharacterized membrane protein YwaF
MQGGTHMNLLTAPSFGSKHLLGLLAIVIGNVILYYVFKKYIKKERQFVIVIMSAFYTLEILKLGYLIIRDGAFPMNHIPLHLCSIPLYVYLIWLLAKPGSLLEEAAKSTAFGVVLIAAIAALLIPVNIIGKELSWALVEDNYLPYVSFTYHGLMIFASWYIIKAGYLTVDWKKILYAIGLTSILMVIAMIVNAITGSDYMLLNEGKGSPLQGLRDTSQVLYTVSMILLGYVMIALTFVVAKLVSKKETV